MRTWLKKVVLTLEGGDKVRALIPVDELAEDDFAKMPANKAMRADVVSPRNPGLHRKAFALLKIVHPHTNYPTMDRLRAAMTIGAGFVDETVDPYSGEVLWYPKSWSFDAMDDIEFQELYSRLIDTALQIVPNSRRVDWENAVNEIVRM